LLASAYDVENIIASNCTVYVDPDIGLEFPFIFEASSCNVYKDQAKMDDIRKSLCRETPCLYELRMECSTTPWFLKV